MAGGVRTFREFDQGFDPVGAIRQMARRAALFGLSMKKDIAATDNWIRFPYYHHVFDDEKNGFERQLKYLKKFGDFISMDEACDLLGRAQKINGRFFCVSFDDGFANCASNMVEVTRTLDIPVLIYLPTRFINMTIDRSNVEVLEVFKLKNTLPIDFLTWEQCQALLDDGVSFGSHAHQHINLATLSDEEVYAELETSKLTIENKLDIDCEHIAIPWGRPGVDYREESTVELARMLGYRSIATTLRGSMDANRHNTYRIHRDHLLANWENFQLKYFFS
ncbi:MAG: polysaccharide deacetylase family protein [Flavobacteriales bacterium]|nr:polysaccharide deacetylase family protein [Flavobacteriales bacterium]